MADNNVNEQTLKAAIRAAVAVDKSHEGLHKALVGLVMTAVDNEWEGIDLINRFLEARPDFTGGRNNWGLTTNSIVEWFKRIVQLDIDNYGKAAPKEDTEYGRAWNGDVRTRKWFHIARELQEFKVPNVDGALEQLARNIARAEDLGQESQYDGLVQELNAKVKAAKATKGHKNWLATAAEAAKKKGLESVNDLMVEEAA